MRQFYVSGGPITSRRDPRDRTGEGTNIPHGVGMERINMGASARSSGVALNYG
jgi:hypothetical protein